MSLLLVGKIISLHGKKGKLKVFFDIDFDIFKELGLNGNLKMGKGHNVLASHIVQTGKPNIAIITLSSLEEINKNKASKDYEDFYNSVVNDSFSNKINSEELYCNREDIPNKLIIQDLLGLDVYIKNLFNREKYGRIVSIDNFGAGDIVGLEVLEEFYNKNYSKKLKIFNFLPIIEKFFQYPNKLYNIRSKKLSNLVPSREFSSANNIIMYHFSRDNFPLIDKKNGFCYISKKAIVNYSDNITT